MDEEGLKIIEDKLKSVEDEELKYLVKELIYEHRQLENIARFDILTGLYNRRILDKIREYSAVVMIDVDNFKGVNDNFGHDEGDRVLKYIAKVLINHIRISDVACRFGGDEFAIIFNSCDLEVILKRMEEIRKEVEMYGEFTNTGVSLSVGVAVHLEGETLEETMKEADIALYNSKLIGKNNVTIYNGNNLTLKRK